MYLVYHGGKCCGVKTIYGFPSSPEQKISAYIPPELSEMERYRRQRHDVSGFDVSSDFFPCPQAFPEHSALERLDALVEWTKKWRPEGVIEITLTDAYQKKWYPLLKVRKFRQVTKFYNSNSGNIVRIFHLTYGEKNEELKKREKRPSKQAAPWSVS